MAKGLRYTPPDWLEDEAKDYIAEVVKDLNRNNNLKKVDIGAIHMLAISYSQFIQASRQVSTEGATISNYRGDPIKHPAVNISKDALAQAMRIITEYGLTLKSRESMAVTKKDDKTDSPLGDFFKEGGKPV